jgi:hypothetical protein
LECRHFIPFHVSTSQITMKKELFIHFLFMLTSIWDFTWFHSVWIMKLYFRVKIYLRVRWEALWKVSETIKNNNFFRRISEHTEKIICSKDFRENRSNIRFLDYFWIKKILFLIVQIKFPLSWVPRFLWKRNKCWLNVAHVSI